MLVLAKLPVDSRVWGISVMILGQLLFWNMLPLGRFNAFYCLTVF